METRTLGDGPGTRVTVEVDWNVLEGTLEAELFEDQGQDSVEVLAQLEAWRGGALYGARYALEVANSLPCALRITEIVADEESTNPTIIAAACAHAVWEVIGFAPGLEATQRLDAAVAASLQAGPDALPTF